MEIIDKFIAQTKAILLEKTENTRRFNLRVAVKKNIKQIFAYRYDNGKYLLQFFEIKGTFVLQVSNWDELSDSEDVIGALENATRIIFNRKKGEAL